MDSQNVTTETLSYRRLVTRNWRQIHTHRLQWFRWWLGLAMKIHSAPIIGKLYWHYSTHHTPSVLPDFLAFVLTMTARFVWLFLFRDPAAFLRFKRPDKAYKWAVCGTLVLTTLPNGLVHFWSSREALKMDTIVLAGIVSATIAIVMWIPIMGLVWWMAWVFLLASNETHDEFEPTTKTSSIVSAEDVQFSASPPEPYLDEASDRSMLATDLEGCLSRAYEEQASLIQEFHTREDAIEYVESHRTASAPQPAEDPTRPSDESQDVTSSSGHLHCQTMARFEYLSQSHSGPHSWISVPLVSLILTTYATILLILLPVWIYEDRHYAYRAPSTTIKKSLYFPLGLYLLALYASKHRLRASLFENYDAQPPEPWKKMLSILPSWVGTGGTFKNMDTGEITVYDPRRRAFPWRAYRQPSLIRDRKYIDAYNANPGACTNFWGHSGGETKSDLRFRPTIHRIGFLLLAMYFAFTGYLSFLSYKVPDIGEELSKHHDTLTTDDVERLFRIFWLWEAFVFSGIGFLLLALVFVSWGIGSMAVLFVGTAWKYVPQEDKERILREARERGNVTSDGRIRLE